MGTPLPYEMYLNRISLYIDGITSLVNRNDQIDPAYFCNLCFSLARCIDFAIANNFVPSNVHGLPSLLKQMCQKKHSHRLKAAVMVLMISTKNACKVRWFSEKEAEELYSLANEIGSDFFGDTNSGPNNSLTTITAVMERFFPHLKLGQIVADMEVKPGYGVFATDFNISKTMQLSQQEKILLFVAQKDNTETSACIITPPQVNFLVNGKGVNGRTNIFMDTGPQLPTNVTHMLKLGANLLQAIGNFNGHYVIAVAIMGTAPLPDSSVLQDYVQTVVSTVDPDSDIIEGPSRISLNCPISYTRIKVPVKSCSCKHLQCFDFYNFIGINSRRPSWRCPHCNQYICFLDIRVDQNMLKVIREVAENVTEVIISADGSWKAILDNGDGRPLDDSLNLQNERDQESTVPVVLDLIEVDDDINICDLEIEDEKPCLGNKNFAAVLDDDFWSGIDTDRILTSSARTDAPIGHVIFSSPALYDQNNLQSQALNSNENSEYGRTTSIARPLSRMPTTAQALPSPSQASGQQYSSRTTTISSAPQVGHSIPTNRDGLNTISRDSERSQQFPRRPGDSHHATNLAPFHHPPTLQNRDPLDHSFTPGQSVQASTALRPSRGLLTDFQNPHLQQALNLRMSQLRNQNPSNNVRPSLPFSRAMSQVGGGYSGPSYAAVAPNSQNARMMVASQRAELMRQSSAMSLQNQTFRSAHCLQTTPDGLRMPTAGELRNVGGMSQSITPAAGLVEPSSEQNWQPSGRMRGSLSGRAFSDAHGHLIIHPTQPVQSARPPSNSTPTQPSAPSTQALGSNGLDTLVPRTR
ncbi:E4 SUMO-protein ligase PIAL2, partial [Cucurbita argyrosperma subsp. sororia]